jgi:hypothetical protein
MFYFFSNRYCFIYKKIKKILFYYLKKKLWNNILTRDQVWDINGELHANLPRSSLYICAFFLLCKSYSKIYILHIARMLMIIHVLNFFYIYTFFIIFWVRNLYIHKLFIGFWVSIWICIIYYSIKNKIVNIYLKYIYVY